jgi:hypothetical protein
LTALVKKLIALLVFAYLIFIRTRGISQTFWLLGDQMLYWRIALGSWRDVPIGGGPSQVGGTTIGPIFCWVLWGIRHVIGPWTHNLPHAGGIGLSIIQSAADAFLFVAIWKRSASLALALAVTLFVATEPYDMALTATIWNPPLAVAFVKTAIACVLFTSLNPSPLSAPADQPAPPALRALFWPMAATAAAVLAVQAHSSAVFVAAPIIASFVLRDLIARQWTHAGWMVIVLVAVILVLEAPYLSDRILHPAKATSPAVVVDSVAYTVAHPSTLRPAAAFQAIARACNFILFRPWTFGWMGWLLALTSAVTIYRERRDVLLLCAIVVPVLAATAGFSFWQTAYDNYWFLVLAPGAALTIAWALTAWLPAAPYVAIALAGLVLVAQNARTADAMTIHRMRAYAPLVRGSLDIRRYTPEIRGIQTEFALPPTTDPAFLYETLGGHLSRDAPFSATISSTGGVVFTPAPSR